MPGLTAARPLCRSRIWLHGNPCAARSDHRHTCHSLHQVHLARAVNAGYNNLITGDHAYKRVSFTHATAKIPLTPCHMQEERASLPQASHVPLTDALRRSAKRAPPSQFVTSSLLALEFFVEKSSNNGNKGHGLPLSQRCHPGD